MNVIYNMPFLLWIKKLNSLIYRTTFYVNIYKSYKLLETVRFLVHPVHSFKQAGRWCIIIQSIDIGNNKRHLKLM